jgi:dienelactone hydrolase
VLKAAVAGAAWGLVERAAAQQPPAPVDIFPLTVTARDGRGVRVRAFAPAESAPPLGVVLFSHGAAATNLGYDRVLIPWARAGYLVLAPNHLDAGGTPPLDILPHDRLWTTRVEDMVALLDSKAAIEVQAAKTGRRFDWSQVGATGHSFGGLTAQALVGAKATPVLLKHADHRVKAVFAMSPPGPLPGWVPDDAWKDIKVPMLVQTGTADAPIPASLGPWTAHLASLNDASSQIRWSMVGEGVDHMFGGLICYLNPKAGALAPQLNIVVEVGTVFLDAYVKDDPAALARLKTIDAAKAYAPLFSVTELARI